MLWIVCTNQQTRVMLWCCARNSPAIVCIKRLLIDYLPGGEFHYVQDPAVISETLSVPKTNVDPERDFANLDRMLLQKPNARHIALESMILFSQNKTSDWLKKKESRRKRYIYVITVPKWQYPCPLSARKLLLTLDSQGCCWAGLLNSN